MKPSKFRKILVRTLTLKGLKWELEKRDPWEPGGFERAEISVM
jgi:hypothetical protein